MTPTLLAFDLDALDVDRAAATVPVPAAPNLRAEQAAAAQRNARALAAQRRARERARAASVTMDS
jgi:hypothetical protein